MSGSAASGQMLKTPGGSARYSARSRSEGGLGRRPNRRSDSAEGQPGYAWVAPLAGRRTGRCRPRIGPT